MGVIRFESNRAIKIRQRLFLAIEASENIPPVVDRFDEIGIERNGPIEHIQRFIETFQPSQSQAEIVESTDILRPDLDQLAELRDALLKFSHFEEHGSQVVSRFVVF